MIARDQDFGWYRWQGDIYRQRHWTHIGAWLAERRARRGKR